MKQSVFTLIATFICLAGYSQETACVAYKNGTFKLTDPDSKKVCVITRDGDHQTEKIENSDEVYDFNITWIDECTYTVTPTAATAGKNKEMLKLGTMTVVITPATDSSYVQTIRVTNSPKFKRKDTVYIVKETE